ncbi:conserved hypothetical protein, partial [Ricinus communis]
MPQMEKYGASAGMHKRIRMRIHMRLFAHVDMPFAQMGRAAQAHIDMRIASLLAFPARRDTVRHPTQQDEDAMTSLNHYLSEKRSAVLAREALIEAGNAGPNALAARVSAEGRSGVRRIRIRDHQVISDSPPDFAGYNLGPSSPELQLGVLGSCVTHIFLIQAAHRQ